MFSKNIKILSLFLILAVVMIGALGAVSAVTPDTPSSTNITTTSGGNAIAQTTPTSNVASGEVSGTITVLNNTTNVPKETPVNSSTEDGSGNLTVTFANGDNIYMYANGTGATGAKIVGPTETNVSGDGAFITNVTISEGNLINGQTYYIPFHLNTTAYAFNDVNGVIYSVSNTTTTQYLSFVYNGNIIALANNSSSVKYGDNWAYSGVLTDSEGNPLTYTGMTATVYNKEGTIVNKAVPLTTTKDGEFIFNSTIYTNVDGNSALPVGNYTVVFTTATGNSVSATLKISKKSLNIDAALNQTTVNYGKTVNLTAIIEASGVKNNATDVTLSYRIISVNPAMDTTTELGTTTNGTYAKEDFANGLKPGVYYITVTGTPADTTNYDVSPSSTLTLTVTQISSTVTAKPNPLVTNTTATNNIIVFTTNTTNGVTTQSGKFTYVLYNATNDQPISVTSSADPVSGTDNPDFGKLAQGDYYVIATWTPADSAISPSTTQVNITVKTAAKITTNATNAKLSYVYNTTGNSTKLNVTLDPALNTTVTVLDGNKTLGTLTLVDGNATYDLGALNLAAGEHNITFVYAGDDTYNAANTTVNVTVTPVLIGYLNTNTTAVTINLTSTATIKLNLTASRTNKTLIDYTGPVTYTVNGVTGTVNMVNGVATFPANSIKGLTNGANTVTFAIKENEGSRNSVDVTITAETINTAIVANNVTTNNATPITITGTVVNATEGNITVALKDADGKTVATTTTTVAADGTFTATFGNFPNGNYTANVTYNSTTGLSANTTTNVSVIVNGTAPTPTPVGNITTVLTLNNFTEVVGAGQNLTGTLTDVNGTPIVGQHIALNLTNPRTGASKIYWVTTDTEGAFQLAINLAVGTYTASASYAGNSYDNVNFTAAGPVAGTITVTSNVTPSNKTATVLTAENYVANATGGNFTGILTANGTPLVGQHITLNLTRLSNGMSKLYYATTDTDGAYQLEINLGAGNYTVAVTYDGTSVYDAASANGTIVMTRA